MSYAPIPGGTHQRLSVEDPPDYEGTSHPVEKHHLGDGRSAASTERLSLGNSSVLQANNYVHMNDVGDILGAVYDINTDQPAIHGRFDTQEEEDQAPNVYLSADNIDVEIRLSGSKKAKLEVKGRADGGYGRTMIRITYPSGIQTANCSTPFTLALSACTKATCLVSLPEYYCGSITGACTLSGRLKEEAVCLAADALKSRWLVRRSGEASTSRLAMPSRPVYPPKAGDDSTETSPGSAAGSDDSSVTFSVIATTNDTDSKGKTQRERRHVLSSSDYMDGLLLLKQVEEEARASGKKALYVYAAVLVVLMLVVQFFAAVAHASPSTKIILASMFGGVSLIIPAIITAQFWGEFTYKIPDTVPSV